MAPNRLEQHAPRISTELVSLCARIHIKARKQHFVQPSTCRLSADLSGCHSCISDRVPSPPPGLSCLHALVLHHCFFFKKSQMSGQQFQKFKTLNSLGMRKAWGWSSHFTGKKVYRAHRLSPSAYLSGVFLSKFLVLQLHQQCATVVFPSVCLLLGYKA